MELVVVLLVASRVCAISSLSDSADEASIEYEIPFVGHLFVHRKLKLGRRSGHSIRDGHGTARSAFSVHERYSFHGRRRIDAFGTGAEHYRTRLVVFHGAVWVRMTDSVRNRLNVRCKHTLFEDHHIGDCVVAEMKKKR